MEDRTITLLQDDGTEVVCDIVFTTFSEEFQKNYVVFQVRKTKEISAAIFYPDDANQANGKLDKIESQEEWEMLEDMLNDYAEQNENGCGGGCSGCGSDCSGCEGGCEGDCGADE